MPRRGHSCSVTVSLPIVDDRPSRGRQLASTTPRLQPLEGAVGDQPPRLALRRHPGTAEMLGESKPGPRSADRLDPTSRGLTSGIHYLAEPRRS
jgi:hypothetical protein